MAKVTEDQIGLLENTHKYDHLWHPIFLTFWYIQKVFVMTKIWNGTYLEWRRFAPVPCINLMANVNEDQIGYLSIDFKEYSQIFWPLGMEAIWNDTLL